MVKRSLKSLSKILQLAIRQKRGRSVEADRNENYILKQIDYCSMSERSLRKYLKAIDSIRNESLSDCQIAEALEIINTKFLAMFLLRLVFFDCEETDIVIRYFKSARPLVYIRAMHTIGVLSFYTFCQDYFVQNGIIQCLTNCLLKDEFIIDAIAVLPQVLNGHEVALKIFITNNGIQLLVNFLSKECDRFSQVCSFIYRMSIQFPWPKDYFASNRIVNILLIKLRIIDNTHLDICYICRVILVLLESPYCQLNTEEVQYMRYKFENILQNIGNLKQFWVIAALSKLILKRLEL